MYACIYELRKNCCGTGGRDGTEIEGSTRGPRGPKKLLSLIVDSQRLKYLNTKTSLYFSLHWRLGKESKGFACIVVTDDPPQLNNPHLAEQLSVHCALFISKERIDRA